MPHPPRLARRSLLAALALLLFGGLLALRLAPIVSPNPALAAWQRAQQHGSYRFTATIEQQTQPVASAGNVGARSHTERWLLDGAARPPEGALELRIAGEGGPAMGPATEIRIDRDGARARQGDGPWEAIDSPVDAFAPEGDLLGYLAAARDLRAIGAETRAGVSFTRYAYTLDGPAFAAQIRERMARQLREAGKLPPGMPLGVADQLAEARGSGEIWVRADGLPLRHALTISFPATAQSQVTTVSTVDFSGFTGFGGWRGALGGWQQLLRGLLPDLTLAALLQTLAALAVALAIAGVLIVRRGDPRLQAVLAVTLSITLVLVPLLQAQSVAAFAAEQGAEARASQAEQAQAAATREVAARLAEPAPSRATPERLAQIRADQQRADADDDDGDGLTNREEALLGTSPEHADTDGDGLSDRAEIEGVTIGDRRWSTDPLELDTNRDGVGDGEECRPAQGGMSCADRDGDGTPDAHDRDNDGDGVPDTLDLSPAAVSPRYNGAQPLGLVLNGLTPGKYTYVEFQVRPDLGNLRVQQAYSMLDWPSDNQGQIQDLDGATFATVGGTAPGDRHGDTRIVPMLEISLSGAIFNLPPPADLAPYGIAVQGLSQGQPRIYVPLQVVSDPLGDNRVALQGKMLYLPGAAGWGNAHQVRLIWAVQLLTDGEGFRNRTIVAQTYSDGWRLSGLRVREDHGVELATVYQDPAAPGVNPNDDSTLALLAHSLDELFLTPRDCERRDAAGSCAGDGRRDFTPQVIAERFNRATNGAVSPTARLGLPNTLGAELHRYSHLDLGIITTAMTTTAGILNRSFTPRLTTANPITPTLLFVREERFRALNLDLLGGQAVSAGAGNLLTLDMAGEGGSPLQTLAGINWAPYAFKNGRWGALPLSDYYPELQRRTDGPRDPADSPVIDDGKEVAAQLYYAVLVKGLTSFVSIGDPLAVPVNLRDVPLGRTDAEQSLINSETIQAAATGAGALLKIVVNAGIMARISAKPLVWEMLGFGAQAAFDKNGNFIRSPSLEDIGQLGILDKSRAVSGSMGVGLQAFSITYMLGIAALIAGGAIFGVGVLQDNRDLLLAGAVVLAVALPILMLLEPIVNIVKATQLASAALGTAGGLIKVLGSRSEIIGSSRLASGIGLLITAATIWGPLIYNIASGNLTPGSTEFNLAIATAVVATVVAIFLFVIGLTVIGSILVSLLSLVDLIMLLLCKASVSGACFSIVGSFTQLIAGLFASGGPMINLGAEDLLRLGTFSIELQNGNAGLTSLNQVRFRSEALYTIRTQDIANNDAVMRFPALRSLATFRTSALNTTLTVDRGASALPPSGALAPNNWAVAQGPAQVFIDFGGRFVVPRFTGTARQPLLSPFTSRPAGINRPFDLFVNAGFQVPGHDCANFSCRPKGASGSRSTSVRVFLDILPPDLDTFRRLHVPISQAGWDPRFTVANQPDFDNDGLASIAFGGADASPLQFDADGDRLSDRFETELNARGIMVAAFAADLDRDGLDDAEELRAGSNPRLADTDGDGLSDRQELEGFLFTYAPGKTVLISSNPQLADSDGDGVEDRAERELHLSDPVAFPFNPRVANPSPVGLTLRVDDADGVVAPGTPLVVTATLRNNAATAALIDGALTITGTTTLREPFLLAQGEERSFSLGLVAPGSSQALAIPATVRARLLAPAPSTAELGQATFSRTLRLTVDGDDPAVRLNSGGFIPAGAGMIIGGTASDPSSAVTLVEVSVDGGPFQPATGTGAWAFALDVPAGAAQVRVDARATDAVGRRSALASATLRVEGAAPVVTADAPASPAFAVRSADGPFSVRLSGAASDPGAGASGVALVEVQVTPNGAGFLPAELSGGRWQIDYPIDGVDAGGAALIDPSGDYTFTVRAVDVAGNRTPAAQQAVGSFTLDNRPPSITLDGVGTTRLITQTQTLGGAVTDGRPGGQGVAAVEIAFTPVALARAIGDALLALPFDERPGATLFANRSPGSAGFCRDAASCPEAGVAGRVGRGVSFGPVRRVVEVSAANLTQAATTISLWLKTTCPNCGLLSSTAGRPGTGAAARQLFLIGGNLCAQIEPQGNFIFCTQGRNLADGQWHHVALVMRDRPELWVDGELAATQLSVERGRLPGETTFAIGFARTGGQTFVGTLDEVLVLPQLLGADEIAALARSFRPATVAPAGRWSAAVPDGLEGHIQIDLAATDQLGNRGVSSLWTGEIDTRAPQATGSTFTIIPSGETFYFVEASDLNLTEAGIRMPCQPAGERRFAPGPDGVNRLVGFTGGCSTVAIPPPPPQPIVVCDRFNRCTTIAPPGPALGGTADQGPRTDDQGPRADGQGTTTDDGRPATVLVGTTDDGRATTDGQRLTTVAQVQAPQANGAGGPSSRVLPPAGGLVVSAAGPVLLRGDASAPAGLASVRISANGALVAELPLAGQAAGWEVSWTPPADGVFTIESVATDSGGAAQAQPGSLRMAVARSAPTVAIEPGPITAAAVVGVGLVEVRGTARAPFGGVELRVGAGPFAPATFDGERWTATVPVPDDADPATVAVTARATDGAGRSAEAQATLTADLRAPEVFGLSASARVGGAAPRSLAGGETLVAESAQLQLTWEASGDGVGLAGYLAGWTDSPLPDPAELTAVGPQAPRSLSITASERQVLYAHVIARDLNGNETAQRLGPVVIDGPATPDLDGIDYAGWRTNPATLLGVSREVSRTAEGGAGLRAEQRLYTTWGEAALRMAWDGADWSGDGDLFVYLDTAAGGATAAHNPFGAPATIALPAGLGADWLLWVRERDTAELLRWDGAAWVGAGALGPDELAYAPSVTEIRLPFARLGIADPATTGLKLVALAVEEGELRPWATLPPENAVSSARVVSPLARQRELIDFTLRHAYAWPSLGGGVLPGGAAGAGGELRVSVSSDQESLRVSYLGDDLLDLLRPGERLGAIGDLPVDTATRPLRDGQQVTYTIAYHNQGDAVARGVAIDLRAYGALRLPGGALQQIAIGDVAPGASGSVQVTATATAAGGALGELHVNTRDAARGVYDWTWLQHQVDAAPPEGLELRAPAAFVRPGLNQLGGVVRDPAGVPEVRLTLELLPTGRSEALVCSDPTPDDGQWACSWDAGDLSGVREVRVRGAAVDGFGAVGAAATLATLAVDTAPPAVRLDAASEAALADGLAGPAELRLGGLVVDDRQADALLACLNESRGGPCRKAAAVGGAEGRWAIGLEDAAPGALELTLYGIDAAGNRGPALRRSFTLDLTPPALTVSVGADGLLTGAARDAGGVAAVYVRVVAGAAGPWRQATLAGEGWRLQLGGPLPAGATLVVEAVDRAGNRATLRQGAGFTLRLPLIVR